MYDMEEYRRLSETGLEQFETRVKTFFKQDIEIEAISEFNLLSSGIAEICEEKSVDLIIMGITGRGKLEETLIGSNTISVARNTKVPVIIVPSNARYQPIEEVLLACDFKKVVETTPVAALEKILDATRAKLFVINIDHDNKSFTPETPFETAMLDTLLHKYNPEYHFVDSTDFTEAINRFATEKKIDLIVTLPRKHGFFENLFKRSHTKMLAFHSHVPLMVIHD
jgi:nucleotide-binding universal stress UspA family protein